MQGAHGLFARFTGQMVGSPPLPIPNLSRGENRALHNARILSTAPFTVRRIRPLPTFFAPRPFLYKAFYSGVGGGGGAGGGLDTGCNTPEQFL